MPSYAFLRDTKEKKTNFKKGGGGGGGGSEKHLGMLCFCFEEGKTSTE